jgi:hypothetical protein
MEAMYRKPASIVPPPTIEESQRFFLAASERHFKIDASVHFNLKWSLARQAKSSVQS